MSADVMDAMDRRGKLWLMAKTGLLLFVIIFLYYDIRSWTSCGSSSS
jgi:hypothetical protein